jgi:hypothetical protein
VAVVGVVVSASMTVTTVAFAAGWAVPASGGSKGLSQSQAALPPSGVSAQCTAPLTQKTITVRWTAQAHTTYSIYQSTTSATSGYSLVASGVAGSSWTSSTLKNGTYWYQVAGVVGGAWTSASSTATASHTIAAITPCT